MHPQPNKLDQLIRLARTRQAEPHPALEALAEGVATRIAARWISHASAKPSVFYWERWSYAGLAVAGLVCLGSSVLGRKPVTAETNLDSPATEISFQTLLEADFSTES